MPKMISIFIQRNTGCFLTSKKLFLTSNKNLLIPRLFSFIQSLIHSRTIAHPHFLGCVGLFAHAACVLVFQFCFCLIRLSNRCGGMSLADNVFNNLISISNLLRISTTLFPRYLPGTSLFRKLRVAVVYTIVFGFAFVGE